jgi:transposase-like protein
VPLPGIFGTLSSLYFCIPDNPEIGALRCPQCNSTRIEYPQLTRKFLTPALAGILFALKVFPKEFYCQDCHFTWTNEPEHPRYRFWNRFFSGPESEG